MATATNSLNINGNGIVAFNNATGAFSNVAMTQFSLLVGGSTPQSITQIAPSATSGVPLISQGASSNPAYGTAVVAGGGTGNTTFTAFSVICAGTTATGAFQNVSGLGSSGQVLTSAGAGALPTWQTPSGGPGGVGAWVDVTGTSQAMAVNTGYLADNAGLVTLTLPSTAAQFTVITVAGKGAGGWKIAQNASQLINVGNQVTTTGTGGSLASTNANDVVSLICTVANTTWMALSGWGNLIVT